MNKSELRDVGDLKCWSDHCDKWTCGIQVMLNCAQNFKFLLAISLGITECNLKYPPTHFFLSLIVAHAYIKFAPIYFFDVLRQTPYTIILWYLCKYHPSLSSNCVHWAMQEEWLLYFFRYFVWYLYIQAK